VFHTSYDWMDPQHQKIKPAVVQSGFLNRRIAKHNVLSCNNVFIRSNEFSKLKFSEDRNLSGTEDWSLWLKLSCRFQIQGISSITSAIIQHDLRSMVMATGETTLKRTIALEKDIMEDECLMKKTFIVNSAMADMYSLSSLYYAISGDKKNTLRFLKKSVNLDFSIIFRRRFIAILKHFLTKN